MIYEIKKERKIPDVQRMIELIQNNELDIRKPNKEGYIAAEHIINCQNLNHEDKLNIIKMCTASQADEFYYYSIIQKKFE